MRFRRGTPFPSGTQQQLQCHHTSPEQRAPIHTGGAVHSQFEARTVSTKEAHQGATAVQAATGLTTLSRVCSGTAFPSCVVSRIFTLLHTFLW